MKKFIIVLLLFCSLLIAGYLIIISFPETDRDLVKYEGRIYSNITSLDWFNEEEKWRSQKEESIGKIKRTSKFPLLLWNFSATKLQKGTVLFNADEKEEGLPLIIIAETRSGEISFYRWLPKE